MHENELLNLTSEVTDLLITRLTDAAGRNSKAFNLVIENTSSESFFGQCHQLKTKTDSEFIAASKRIGDLLALCQARTNIPGGYFIFLQAFDPTNEIPLYIAIKAEPHSALQRRPGQTQLERLQVFLSPSQKLYKIGIIYKNVIEEETQQLLSGEENGQVQTTEEDNSEFLCFLYDDQFRAESHPAEYFYKDFLGFSIGKNGKIQSSRFFQKTEKFIIEKIPDFEQKSAILNALRTEFSENQLPLITPSEVARHYMPTPALQDEYISEVAHELPPSFVKDSTLIKGRINKRKVDFPNDVKIVGPNEQFDEKVKIILDTNDLGDIDLSDENITVVVIEGKPYQND